MEPTREQAWETLTRYTKSESLLRHALAVEASTAAYARKFGEDEELWRVAALLHDFDYEMHPTLDKHPQDGAPILREEGYPEEVIETVLSHAEHLGLPRDTPLKKALFACDELSGFIHACALVRPTGLEGLEPKSVKKKLKQPSFAAGVHREDVYKGAEELGVELDDHIRTVVAALQPIAAELGLPALARPTSRRRSSSLVHQPHEARTRLRPGSSRTITPRSASAATSSVGSPGGRNETSVEWPGGVTTSTSGSSSSRQRAAAVGGALVAPLRMHPERRLEARERRRADPAGVEPSRAVLRRRTSRRLS